MDKFVEAKYKMMERDRLFCSVLGAILFSGTALIGLTFVIACLII